MTAVAMIPAAVSGDVIPTLDECEDEYNKFVRDEAEKLRPLVIGKRTRPNRVWAQ